MVDLDNLPLMHTRNYDTRSYLDGDAIVVVGEVCDTKPPGLYVADDPEPLPIHRMRVVLKVSLETLTVVDADVEMTVHPHQSCPDIVERYRELVGLSVTRGYGRAIRELFGGPRGCSHTTALLQAMGPVVTQTLWSVRTHRQREQGVEPFGTGPDTAAEIAETNRDTCHVWAADGEHLSAVLDGGFTDVPVWIRTRLEELGRDYDEWRASIERS